MTLELSTGRDVATVPHAAITYARAVQLSAEAFGVSPADRRWRRKSRVALPLERARRIAIYLSVVACNYGLRDIAEAAGLSHEGVRKALRAVEDWRDDPIIDQQLEQLEEELAL